MVCGDSQDINKYVKQQVLLFHERAKVFLQKWLVEISTTKHTWFSPNCDMKLLNNLRNNVAHYQSTYHIHSKLQPADKQDGLWITNATSRRDRPLNWGQMCLTIAFVFGSLFLHMDGRWWKISDAIHSQRTHTWKSHEKPYWKKSILVLVTATRSPVA